MSVRLLLFLAATLVAAAQQSSPRTLVFLGDSLTAGFGLTNPAAEAYPALIQAKITAAQEAARQDAEVTKKLDEFKVQLYNKMVELDPTVQELTKELETLQSSGSASGGSL